MLPLLSQRHSAMWAAPGGLISSSDPSTSPAQPVTLMHSPGGIGSAVVHATLPPAGVHFESCPELAGKLMSSSPAGAAVLPRLQTGTVMSHGTPTVKSTPRQFGSVSVGDHGTQFPLMGQDSPHTDCTMEAHLFVHEKLSHVPL